MIDSALLGDVRRGRGEALGKIIDKYNAYVCAIIRNTVNMPAEDVEETSSDVFVALWQNTDRIHNLKSWLGATARNKAKNKLRERRDDIPLNDDIEYGSIDTLEDQLIADSERGAVISAISALGQPDSEIFMRRYYENESAAEISVATGLTEAAVKMRLSRGRKKLRQALLLEVN